MALREIRSGQQGGETKNPPCQSARRVSWKLYQLFSSFLRGASCPKSPRVAATAASSFMPNPPLNVNSFRDKHHQRWGPYMADRFLTAPPQLIPTLLCAIFREHFRHS